MQDKSFSNGNSMTNGNGPGVIQDKGNPMLNDVRPAHWATLV